MEIQYLFNGSMTILEGETNNAYTLTAGDCCIVPGEHHHSTDASDPFERITFNWHIEKNSGCDTANSKEYDILEKIYNSVDDITIIHDEILIQMMNQYKVISNDPKRVAIVERRTMLLNIIMHIMSLMAKQISFDNPISSQQHESTEKSSRKWIIEEHISSNYYVPDGLSGLAKKLYLSERQTRALVLKTFGKNYKEMIIEQRMENANIMLRNPLLSLDEISQQIGYRSYSGFYLAYTKYYGISPEEKRKKLKEFSNKEKEKKNNT